VASLDRCLLTNPRPRPPNRLHFKRPCGPLPNWAASLVVHQMAIPVSRPYGGGGNDCRISLPLGCCFIPLPEMWVMFSRARGKGPGDRGKKVHSTL
jgi:hypothetical protein